MAALYRASGFNQKLLDHVIEQHPNRARRPVCPVLPAELVKRVAELDRPMDGSWFGHGGYQY